MDWSAGWRRAAQAPASADREELIVRMPREGDRVDPAALADNPFEGKSTWHSALRAAGSRGWTAAALAVAIVALGWHLRPATPPDEVVRDSPDGIVRLAAANPWALTEQIVDELRAAGIEANGYRQLGVSGIDADLPRPLTPEIRGVLDKHGIPVPESGVLNVEILAQQ